MSSSGVRAGHAYVELGTRDNLRKGLDRAKRQLTRFAKIAATLSAGAATGITGFVTAATKSYMDLGTELSKVSNQTGVSVESLSQLKFAAESVGVPFEDLTGALEEFNIRMGETIQDGTGPMSEAFKKLGLDAKELSRMPVADAIGKIGDALKGLNASDRGFLADEIFGGDGFKLMQLLNQGSAGLADLATKAEDLGLVMDDRAAKGAKELNDTLVEMKQVMSGLAMQIGGDLAPELTRLGKLLTQFAKDWDNTFRAIELSTEITSMNIIDRLAGFLPGGQLLDIPEVAEERVKRLDEARKEMNAILDKQVEEALDRGDEQRRKMQQQREQILRGQMQGPPIEDFRKDQAERIALQEQMEDAARRRKQQKDRMDAAAFQAALAASSAFGQVQAVGTFATGASSAFSQTRSIEKDIAKNTKSTAEGVQQLVGLANANPATILTFSK